MVQRLARPLAGAGRPRGSARGGLARTGTAGPGSAAGRNAPRGRPGTQVLRLRGPVEIVIRQR
jgi:hypothetical protein